MLQKYMQEYYLSLLLAICLACHGQQTRIPYYKQYNKVLFSLDKETVISVIKFLLIVSPCRKVSLQFSLQFSLYLSIMALAKLGNSHRISHTHVCELVAPDQSGMGFSYAKRYCILLHTLIP